ncbi:MAG: hypothetical protein ACREOS_05665, partial [Candidatus Dormibacteraceae bacterium]
RGLDPIAALELRRFVRERVADGRRTVLVATHIMAEAEGLCHRVAFLSQGRVRLIGSIDQLRGALRAEDVHRLRVSQVERAALAALSVVTGVRSLAVTAGDAPSTHDLELVVERGSAAVPTVIRAIVQQGGLVWSSIPQELSLEHMFTLAMERDQPAGEVEDPVGDRVETAPIGASREPVSQRWVEAEGKRR